MEKRAAVLPLPSHVRRSISWRLNLWYATYFIMATTMLFIVVYWYMSRELTTRDRREVEQRYNLVLGIYKHGGLPMLQLRMPQLAETQRDAFFVRLQSPANGHKLWFVRAPEDDPIDEAKVEKFITKKYEGRSHHYNHWDEIPSVEPERSWSVYTTHFKDGSSLQVGMLTPNLPQLLGNFRMVFVCALLCVIALGICGGMLVTSHALRPVRWLAETVRSILATRTMAARVPVSDTRDELAELSELFNRMLDQQQYLIRSMHEALDNVAHDLRTPLTRLRGSAEVALQEEQENATALRESLQDCLEESERVTSMLTTLMDISEAETGSMKLHLSELDLAHLVRGLVEMYSLASEDEQVRLKLDLPAELKLTGDSPRLQQVVGNLLDNAIKYSASGGNVAVRLCEEDGKAVLTVADEGIGIAAEDLERIWERLYRADKSRSRRGLGLGLSFVRAIVEAHDGQASVFSEPGKGSTFKVELPLKQAEE